MNVLTMLAGAAHWSFYATVFASFAMVFMSRRPSWWSLAKAGLLTALVYFSPVLFCGGFWLIGGLWVMSAQAAADAVRDAGVITFTYNFFGDNRFTGWSSQQGASHLPISGSAAYVPQAMRDAAYQAMAVDPYHHPCGVVVFTKVHMDGKGPVIVDYVATDEQVVRRNLTGMWDKPQDYQQHESGIVTHSDPSGADGTMNEDGMVMLSAPKGLAAEFMSQFNGPKLTPIVRSKG